MRGASRPYASHSPRPAGLAGTRLAARPARSGRVAARAMRVQVGDLCWPQ